VINWKNLIRKKYVKRSEGVKTLCKRAIPGLKKVKGKSSSRDVPCKKRAARFFSNVPWELVTWGPRKKVPKNARKHRGGQGGEQEVIEKGTTNNVSGANGVTCYSFSTLNMFGEKKDTELHEVT